eukprot:3059685-Rhodomonas_salina.2
MLAAGSAQPVMPEHVDGTLLSPRITHVSVGHVTQRAPAPLPTPYVPAAHTTHAAPSQLVPSAQHAAAGGPSQLVEARKTSTEFSACMTPI